MAGVDVRRVRVRLGMTQEDLATVLNERLGRQYTKTQVSNWENDRNPVPKAVEMVLADLQPVGTGTALVVALANQKGGVAKTTVAVNLAATLATAGCRVLLVDTDAQANATLAMGLSPPDMAQAKATLYHVIVGETDIAAAIVEPFAESRPDITLSLLPSSLEIEDLSLTLVTRPDWSRILERQLRRIGTRYDVIILDCPPNLGVMTANALTAADLVLIPSEAEPFGVYGINLLLSRIAGFQDEINPRLEVIGIVPTKYNKGHAQDAQSLADIQELYGPTVKIFPPIPRLTVWTQAAYVRKPLVLEEANVPGTETISEIAADIMARARLRSMVPAE